MTINIESSSHLYDLHKSVKMPSKHGENIVHTNIMAKYQHHIQVCNSFNKNDPHRLSCLNVYSLRKGSI